MYDPDYVGWMHLPFITATWRKILELVLLNASGKQLTTVWSLTNYISFIKNFLMVVTIK